MSVRDARFGEHGAWFVARASWIADPISRLTFPLKREKDSFGDAPLAASAARTKRIKKLPLLQEEGGAMRIKKRPLLQGEGGGEDGVHARDSCFAAHVSWVADPIPHLASPLKGEEPQCSPTGRNLRFSICIFGLRGLLHDSGWRAPPTIACSHHAQSDLISHTESDIISVSKSNHCI
jgi:hypothetical protein